MVMAPPMTVASQQPVETAADRLRAIVTNPDWHTPSGLAGSRGYQGDITLDDIASLLAERDAALARAAEAERAPAQIVAFLRQLAANATWDRRDAYECAARWIEAADYLAPTTETET